ncbi:MAG: glutaredoxin domain-containing protein [bacterium]
MKKIIAPIVLLLIAFNFLNAQKAITFSTEKNPGILSFYGHNNTADALEITLTLKDIKMLKGYTEPITKLVPANSKVKFIDLTYKYDVYNYRMAYTYKKPESAMSKKLKGFNKEDFYLSDLSKIDEGIVVFDDEGCGDCRMVLNYLYGNDFDFKIVSLATNKEHQKFMFKTIKEKGASMKVKLPVVIVNGKVSHSVKDWNSFLKTLH